MGIGGQSIMAALVDKDLGKYCSSSVNRRITIGLGESSFSIDNISIGIQMHHLNAVFYT